jgi:hypothetical protein|tara:strand:+ start:1947 stop:2315 length:369 start_codon:yes stop_codon:yes gene_type:complete
MNLYNIAESLILETINRSMIMDIMDQRRLVEISYDDEQDPGGEGNRWVEIVAYGKSKANNDVVRAYQVGGDTKTIQPGWKLFRVDRFLNFIKLSGTFDTPRPKFNPNGDKSMIEVYGMTRFN